MSRNIPTATFAAIFALTGACATLGEPSGELLGEVTASISQVPDSVRCVRVLVTAEESVDVREFAVVPGASVSLTVARLPYGSVALKGEAFNLPCGTVEPSIEPAWISAPVVTEIEFGAVTNITLVLRRNLPADVDVVFEEPVVQVVASSTTTYALTADGRVLCWGYNPSGECGLGLGSPSIVTRPSEISTLSNVVTLAAGESHACAIVDGGTVYCWGRNDRGQLGDGTTTSRRSPVLVNGLSDMKAIAAGYKHTCAVAATGNRYHCWGSNQAGNLGDGTLTDRTTPTSGYVAGGVAGVTCGNSHTCVLTATGQVSCFGDNAFGQLGVGDTVRRMSPISLSGLNASTQLSSGRYHTCALRADGVVHCWGRGQYGQLGSGSSSNQYDPVEISSLSTAVRVAPGGSFTCSLATDGTVRCVGENRQGQLGDGSGSNTMTPVVPLGLDDVVDVVAGAEYACALEADGRVLCWGTNWLGQLGTGDNTSSFIPTPVIW